MYKQVIVIRCDLKMSVGKLVSQSCHASYSVIKKVSKKKLEKWEKQGQKKIILKTDLQGIKSLEKKCKKLKIKYSLITDAGLTELIPGTITAIGIGPDEGENIDKVTGSLPLLE